jgi:hypothetical protein
MVGQEREHLLSAAFRLWVNYKIDLERRWIPNRAFFRHANRGGE